MFIDVYLYVDVIDVRADSGSVKTMCPVSSMCRRCQLTVDESQAKIANLDRQLSLCKQSEHQLKQQLLTAELTTKQQMREMVKTVDDQQASSLARTPACHR